MSNTYLALTIGPVVETLLAARKTRMLWGASYILSYIVKNIIATASSRTDSLKSTDFKWNNNLLPISPKNVLLPTIADYEYTFGAGLYPDRIYIASFNPENDSKQLNQAIDKVIWDLSYDMAGHISKEGNSSSYSAKETGDYLRNYFRINVAQISLQEGQNILENMTPYLDASEQHPRILPPQEVERDNPLMQFLDKVNGSFLFFDGFGNNEQRIAWINQLSNDNREVFTPLISELPKKRFKSLIEISTMHLSRQNADALLKYKNIIKEFIEDNLGDEANAEDNEKAENDIIAAFRKADNFKEKWRAFHKYIAIVHIDGDNVGKIVSQVAANETHLKIFSTKLRQFALDANKEVVKYGGSPVYAGGDDLLFFAPVASIHKPSGNFQTIFQLAKTLDDLFENSLGNYASQVGADKNNNGVTVPKLKPSLTYGISISYYKYPLYEARNTSFFKMEHIKSDCNSEKNAIGVKFLKHSGQKIEFTIHKHRTTIWQAFSDFVENNTGTSRDANFLNSLTHRLEDLWVQLKSTEGMREYLLPFFKNNFNENWGRYESFYMSIIDLIEKCWNDPAVPQIEKDEKYGTEKPCWLDPVYGALRFVHFINSKDKGDE